MHLVLTLKAIQDYTSIEVDTKNIYIKQHKNYSVDKSIFKRHLAAAQDLKTYDLPLEFFGNIHVLDAGCGNTGYFQVAMKNLGALKVTCLDIGSEWIPELLSVLSEHSLDSNFAECIPGSTTQLPFPDNTFDLTCSNGVLMHLETVESAEIALKELIRVTRPGGYVYSHIGIDKPGIVDRYIVPSLRQAYQDDLDFKQFIDGLDPKEVVDDLLNIYQSASVHDPRVSQVAPSLEKLITLDTTTFWQNMLQVPIQQGPLLSQEWGINTMNRYGLTSIKRPPGTYWLRNDFRAYLAPLHYFLESHIASLFYGNGHVKLIGYKPH